MNFARLLPKREGVTSVGEWGESWLIEIKTTLNTPVDPQDLDVTRTRNERLASYLPTLTTLAALYQRQVDLKKSEYVFNNPKPEKGVTEWREAQDAVLADFRNTRDFLVNLREDIATRLSVSQSNLKSKTEEIKHGG